MPLFPRIWVNYQSDIYPCPYPSIFKDASQLFTNCVQLTQNAAYPCLNYDNTANSCVQCQQDYILEEGKCFLKIDCGLDRYFHVGGCFDAPPHCLSFRLIGGTCTKCADGYVLDASTQGICKAITVPPNLNTAYVQTTPPNAQNNSIGQQPSMNTSTFISNVTNIANEPSYGVKPATPSISCDSGTYLYQGLCVLFPPHCL